MSRYQHFFIPLILTTLLAGCAVLQPEDPQGEATSNQPQTAERILHLEQGMETLEAELSQAEQRIRQLETEKADLEAKLEALTAIERSLHERMQRQSD
ncbi:hypothetical protein [Marinospirillum alkaliphilum]|uniref:Uncharacterized protein n=1 Tax=Marinospirillum alkaliphilum DSM 21637 TaxID=1122209 RepID=A0A1K1V6R1_9GAMM|nr:hypothetical protein [Marinospirillum alkaliphilum]SFX20800.1 hypothetical protein SAMN02745752_00808 [Marinospirillum alkaliphilum DSM 21637]